MATWNTRGLRGSTLEELINRTNEIYLEKGLALIQKVPTPITPLKIDKESRHITLAYFDQKSTVDYIGVVQGIPVCFDAKECNTDTFPLANIHPHQVAFMEQFEKQDGIAFLLLSFTHRDEFYYLRLSDLRRFWKRAEEGGRKSFRYEELDPAYRLPEVPGILVPYLNVLQQDLEARD
jgi:recombination protein U